MWIHYIKSQSMIVFEARTLEELIVEVREKEIEIGVESVISTLIGLETGVRYTDNRRVKRRI
jgi:hypothetical protein